MKYWCILGKGVCRDIVVVLCCSCTLYCACNMKGGMIMMELKQGSDRIE